MHPLLIVRCRQVCVRHCQHLMLHIPAAAAPQQEVPGPGARLLLFHQNSARCHVSRVTCHNPCRVQTHFFAMLCLPNFAQNLLHFAQISTYLHIQLAQLASFVCPQENIEYIYPAESRPLLIKIWNEMKISILSSLHSERVWFSVSQQLPAERGLERLM